MKGRVGRAAFCIATAAGLAACREKGRPDPSIRMAISHEREEATSAESGTQGSGPKIPNRLEVPAGVTKAFSGIVLNWKDSSNGKEGRLEVPLGGSAELPGSGLTVSADVFLPAFTMTAEVITSSGTEEQNPAARIHVSEKGAELFGGWIFKNFPDVHPFAHPRFSLRLEGGVRKTAA